MELNRVLEIDINTKRNPKVLVRILKTTPHRKGIIPHKTNYKLDIIVLREGLLAAILCAEAAGICKKGEAMKKVIEGLQEGYTDATAEVHDTRMNEKGIIYPDQPSAK